MATIEADGRLDGDAVRGIIDGVVVEALLVAQRAGTRSRAEVDALAATLATASAAATGASRGLRSLVAGA